MVGMSLSLSMCLELNPTALWSVSAVTGEVMILRH